MATEVATFAGGCFWCTEAFFRELKGVQHITPGYSGGSTEHPTYESIHHSPTGHAECIQIVFDPAVISYRQLLEVFFGTHDPTQTDGQGHDIGPEYRSAVFYHSDNQRADVERVIAQLTADDTYSRPIVTEVRPFTAFYPAEKEHRAYYEQHPDAAYCRVVIDSKIAQFRKQFAKLRA